MNEKANHNRTNFITYIKNKYNKIKIQYTYSSGHNILTYKIILLLMNKNCRTNN